MTTSEQLDELERLSKAATPGPWKCFHFEYVSRIAGQTKLADVYSQAFKDEANQHANAELLTNLRNDADSLIAAARLNAELATALENLINRLDAVEADERYKSVWLLYALHGGKYTEPTYEAALNEARAALAKAKEQAGV